jgi:hypothetical protein
VEHTATSTLIREQEIGLPIEPLSERTEIPRPPDVRPIVPSDEPSVIHRIIGEGGVVFLLAFGLYLVVALLLDFKYRTFAPDAVSRMANGFYVLYSRDPHLAAVGFVWTPLQSMADLVALLGNHLWPALSHNDMAGSLVSALAMAGTAYQICSALREWGLSRMPRLVLTACFALNPMIVLYAGNGMSEALYLFTLVASTRYLLRWIRGGDLRSLAYAAVALGFSYLARNEAAGAAMLGAAAVGAVSYWRARGRRPSRARTAMSDAAIFAAPAFIAAVGWAVTSYVITGHLAEQFSSVYGNSQQLLSSSGVHKTLGDRALFEFHAIEALVPLLPVVLVVSVVVALRKRDPRVLAPLAVLGGALGFDMLAYLGNSIFPWLRFYIPSVPLEVLLVGSLVAAVQTSGPDPVEESVGTRPSHSGAHAMRALAGIGLVLVVMIPATVTTASAMLNPNIGSLETQQLGFIFHAHPSASDLENKDYYPQILAMSSYFAGLHLPDGDIVVDNFSPCIPGVLTTISQPKLFVIPNDRDFQRILADPIAFHAHYILEPNPAEFPVTATNSEYPGLWSTGSDFTKMVHQLPARGLCPEFRLFQVLHHSNQVA